MLFYTTFARRTSTVSLNELFENYTGRHTHVYSGRMTRLKNTPCIITSLEQRFSLLVVYIIILDEIFYIKIQSNHLHSGCCLYSSIVISNIKH